MYGVLGSDILSRGDVLLRTNETHVWVLLFPQCGKLEQTRMSLTFSVPTHYLVLRGTIVFFFFFQDEILFVFFGTFCCPQIFFFEHWIAFQA